MASELAGIPVLDREGIELKAELERRHWWFRGRRLVLEAALDRLQVPVPSEVLDLGCGTGATMLTLGSFGSVSGIDVNPHAVSCARRRGVGEVSEASAAQVPYEDGRFGLITCLDVLEHIEDDGAALAEAARVAAPGAFLVVTAPAYQRLFSGHDVAAGHRRRYSLRGLRGLAEASGWTPVISTHFNSFLLPVAAVRRALTRSTAKPRSDLLATPRWADGPLLRLLALEAALVRAGASLPAGLSILLAVRRTG